MSAHPLPLYPGSVSCVGSGYCCKQRPCPFGAPVSDTDNACRHLAVVEQAAHLYPRYRCGIYDEIVTKPGWELAPAFGAGCCSPLFNDDRDAILRDMETAHV